MSEISSDFIYYFSDFLWFETIFILWKNVDDQKYAKILNF